MQKHTKLNPDQLNVLELLGHESDVCLMVAPSFVVDFNYKTFVPKMKGLGFDYVSEVTFGAKITNQNYHEYIKKNKETQSKFIASVCPMCVNIIKAKHPELVSSLLPFDSPMVAMAKVLKKMFPNNKIVFLSPCTAKKIEAKYCGIIDGCITFKEMKEILKYKKTKPKKCSHLFDRFYNDYTKIYPLAGGLAQTIHAKDILKKEEMVSSDGINKISPLFEKYSDKKFYDILFCDGGCIGGNGIASSTPVFMRKYSVLSYRKFADKEKIGSRKGIDKYSVGINFSKLF
jgi:iron only hydrogenase large subunit-like protein